MVHIKTLPIVNSLIISEGNKCIGVYNEDDENKNKFCEYDINNNDVKYFPLISDDENIFYPKSDKGVYFISHTVFDEDGDFRYEVLKLYDKVTLDLKYEIPISKLIKDWEEDSNILECAELDEDKILIIFEVSPLDFSLKDLFSNDEVDTYLYISIYDVKEEKFDMLKKIEGDFYNIDFYRHENIIKFIEDNDEEDDIIYSYKLSDNYEELTLEKEEIKKINIINREEGNDFYFVDKDFGLEIIHKYYKKNRKACNVYKSLKTGNEFYTQLIKMFDDTDYEIIKNMDLLLISESRGNSGYLHIYEKDDDFVFIQTLGCEGLPDICNYEEYGIITAEDENGTMILREK
ncbi:hypothetical protein [Anaerofustis stercorihominis]|uniref:hypothetical protein n=1 Tax=Anaerofustis stercorihominis TaxID=214853 RepID=UPI00398429CC